jgi:hypothetical protein
MPPYRIWEGLEVGRPTSRRRLLGEDWKPRREPIGKALSGSDLDERREVVDVNRLAEIKVFRIALGAQFPRQRNVG